METYVQSDLQPDSKLGKGKSMYFLYTKPKNAFMLMLTWQKTDLWLKC